MTEKPEIERRHTLQSIAAHMQSIWKGRAKSLKTNAAHILQRICAALQSILQSIEKQRETVQRICSASPRLPPKGGKLHPSRCRLALTANVTA